MVVVPTIFPWSSFQTKLSVSPSGSLDFEPSSVTEVPFGPAHSIARSAHALATGGWLAAVGDDKLLKRNCKIPGVAYCQAALMPVLSTAIFGAKEGHASCERISVEKGTPESG